MAISVVQTKVAYNATATPSLTFDTAVGASSHVIAGIGIAVASGDVGTMGGTAPGSGAWTQRAVITTTYHSSLHTAETTGTPGTTVSFGTTPSSQKLIIAIEALGLDAGSLEAVSPFQNDWTTGTSATKQFRLTPPAGEVLLIAVYVGSKTVSSFTANGFTELIPGTISGRAAYRVVTADGTTAYGPDWVCSDQYGSTCGTMIALKAAILVPTPTSTGIHFL